MAAAHGSSDHAERAESSNVGDPTLDQLREDVIRISRDLAFKDPIPVFGDAVRIRDRIYRLLDGHQYPGQTTQLYFLASVICCALADASHSFGYRTAALEQTRAAWAYAEIIGHNSLRVWCRSMQSWLAFLEKQPQNAVRLAQSGHRWAADNEASHQRLYSMEGTALALMGDREGALDAFNSARDSRERITGTDDFFDDVGGLFGAEPAKQFQNSANGLILLGMAPEAAEAAQTAISLYEGLPAGERDYSLEASARISLSTAHLLQGRLDDSRAALAPVLMIPSNQRVDFIRVKLRELQSVLLRSPHLRGAQDAVILEGQIEEFTANSVPRLPSG